MAFGRGKKPSHRKERKGFGAAMPSDAKQKQQGRMSGELARALNQINQKHGKPGNYVGDK
jgi:hypothetical protein